MQTLALYNLKGGVGKTTAAVNMAYFAAQEGCRTLLWDLDTQGSATFHFRITAATEDPIQNYAVHKMDRPIQRLIRPTNYPNLDVIPANFKIRHLDVVLKDLTKGKRVMSKLIQALAPSYDYLLFDCPASISLLAQTIFQTADYLIIPVIPTTLSFQTFQRIQHYLARYARGREQSVPFFSMVDLRKTLHREIMSKFGPENGFCKAFIQTRSIIEQMGRYRAPLPDYDQESRAFEEYHMLWEEIKIRTQHALP
jgi:chromosome partitioning protein